MSVNGVGLNRLFKGEIGDGSVIRFWIDAWACEEPLKDRFPLLFKLDKEKKSTVKVKFEAGNRSFRGFSNGSRAPSMEELEEWNNFTRLMTPLVLDCHRDKWRWVGGSDGKFSVKSVKVFLKSGVDYSDRFIFKWSKWVTKECNVFMWRVSMDRLPTMVALKARKCTFDGTSYVFCEEAEETIEHLLCCCDLAVSIWYRVGMWCKVSPIFFFSTRDIFEIHKYVDLDKKSRKIFKGIIFVACWCLWRARNEKKFERETVGVEKVFQEIKTFSFQWYKNRSKNSYLSWQEWNSFNVY